MRSSAASGCDRSRSRKTAKSFTFGAGGVGTRLPPSASMLRNRASDGTRPVQGGYAPAPPSGEDGTPSRGRRKRVPASTGCASTRACARTRSSSTWPPTSSRSRPAGSPSKRRVRTSANNSQRPGHRPRGRLRGSCSGASRRTPLFGVVGETVVAGEDPDPPGAGRAPRDQERDHVHEGVRQGKSRFGDPRPLQPGRRLPHEQGLPRCLPGAAERQPRRARPLGRQDGLAARAGRLPPAHRSAARRLPAAGPLEAVLRKSAFDIERRRCGGAPTTRAGADP